jgi:putative transposase
MRHIWICRWGRKDSYQGTPSGVPKQRERRNPALAAASVSVPVRHSDPINATAGAGAFFVTSSIREKRSLLQSDRAAGLFVRVLRDYRAQNKYRLHEFVAMPDHFHVMLTLECNMTIERAVQFIKGGFAFRAGRELGFRAPIWQKGFSEVRVLDADAFLRTAEYIRNNPVARHLVDEAEQFPYSSAYPGFELDPAPQGLKPVSRLSLQRYG